MKQLPVRTKKQLRDFFYDMGTLIRVLQSRKDYPRGINQELLDRIAVNRDALIDAFLITQEDD